jgi:hypothetical protein
VQGVSGENHCGRALSSAAISAAVGGASRCCTSAGGDCPEGAAKGWAAGVLGVKIGVVSDTHGFFDTRLDELLAGVELILHAGDVGKQEVLGELQRIAPVRPVRGNVDPSQLGFPFSMTLNLGRTPSGSSPESSLFKVELFHELSIPQAELEKWGSQASVEGDAARGRDTFLRGFDLSTRVIVFGHSHVPCAVALGGKLFFNPGSAGKQRFSCHGLAACWRSQPEGWRRQYSACNGIIESCLIKSG